jgi:integrase/recombinase XerD
MTGADSFAALLEKWWLWLGVQHYSAETVASRKAAIKGFTDWCAERGLTRPAQISKPILERYQRHLHTYRKADGQPLSHGTQRGRLSVVKVFFAWLVKQNHIPADPSAGVEQPRGEHRLPVNALTIEEVETVLGGPDTSTLGGFRDRTILEVLYATAIRRTELCSIQLHDIDWGRNVLFVRQGKGRKDRVVPVGARARAWLEVYRDHVRPHLVAGKEAPWLFLNRDGGQIMPKKLSGRVGGYIAAVRPGGSCHLLRHTAATLMLEGGADIRYIQALLGHENLGTTQIYTQVSITRLQQVHADTHPGAASRRDAQELAALLTADAGAGEDD